MASEKLTPPASVHATKKVIAGSHTERMKILRDRRTRRIDSAGKPSNINAPTSAKPADQRNCWRSIPCCQSQKPAAGAVAK
jgi:hypothetical protein